MSGHAPNNPFVDQPLNDAGNPNPAVARPRSKQLSDLIDSEIEGVAFTPADTNVKVEYYPKEILHPDEMYVDADRVAKVAHANEQSYQESVGYVRKNLNTHALDNTALQELEHIIDNTRTAVKKLTGIGYMNFRHLEAAGFTLHEIAASVGVNVLDLIAYMAAHPDAEKHAQIDATACADAKFSKLLNTIERSSPVTKYEADKMKVLTSATELLVKRLSADWVGAYRDTEAGMSAIGGGGGLTINMNIGGKSAVPAPEADNAKIINSATGGDSRTLTIDTDQIISDEAIDMLADELGV